PREGGDSTSFFVALLVLLRPPLALNFASRPRHKNNQVVQNSRLNLRLQPNVYILQLDANGDDLGQNRPLFRSNYRVKVLYNSFEMRSTYYLKILFNIRSSTSFASVTFSELVRFNSTSMAWRASLLRAHARRAIPLLTS